MVLQTVPGIWNSDEGIETKGGMERAVQAKGQFASLRGSEMNVTNSGPKVTGNKLG